MVPSSLAFGTKFPGDIHQWDEGIARIKGKPKTTSPHPMTLTVVGSEGPRIFPPSISSSL